MGLMCGNLHLDIPEWCEPEWRGLLEACLEPNPGNRPSMRELAKQLEAIRDQQVAHERQQQEEEQQQASKVQQAAPAVQPVVNPQQQGAGEPALVQRIQQQMQQLSTQPAHVQPPLPTPVALLHRQQQQEQQVYDKLQPVPGYIEGLQQLNQQHMHQDQLLTDECAWRKQQMASQQEHAAQLALHGISLSAHAGVLAAVSHAPVLVPDTGQVGLQHHALQQLHLQQTCGLLQPPLPLQPPVGSGFIQLT